MIRLLFLVLVGAIIVCGALCWVFLFWCCSWCFFSCTDPENIVRGGPTLIMFLVDDNGLTSTQQLNAITMVFRWLADSGQTLNAGLVAL